MRCTRSLLGALAASVVGGCGTYVPEIQEFPQNTAQGQEFVQAIIQNVECEVRNAVYDVIHDDEQDLLKGYNAERQTLWLENWGAQMSLNLQIDESTTISPNANLLPASPATALFNLALGGTASATATRTEKIGSYYAVSDLRKFRCDPASRPGGLFMMQSDLKLKQWLQTLVIAGGSGVVNVPDRTKNPLKAEVITHEIKFNVVTSGSLTPGWRLQRAVINQSGSFLSANRSRVHSLIITLGPADIAKDTKVVTTSKGGKKKQQVVTTTKAVPSATAAFSHLSSEIGLAVSTGIRTEFPTQ